MAYALKPTTVMIKGLLVIAFFGSNPNCFGVALAPIALTYHRHLPQNLPFTLSLFTPLPPFHYFALTIDFDPISTELSTLDAQDKKQPYSSIFVFDNQGKYQWSHLPINGNKYTRGRILLSSTNDHIGYVQPDTSTINLLNLSGHVSWTNKRPFNHRNGSLAEGLFWDSDDIFFLDLQEKTYRQFPYFWNQESKILPILKVINRKKQHSKTVWTLKTTLTASQWGSDKNSILQCQQLQKNHFICALTFDRNQKLIVLNIHKTTWQPVSSLNWTSTTSGTIKSLTIGNKKIYGLVHEKNKTSIKEFYKNGEKIIKTYPHQSHMITSIFFLKDILYIHRSASNDTDSSHLIESLNLATHQTSVLISMTKIDPNIQSIRWTPIILKEKHQS